MEKILTDEASKQTIELLKLTDILNRMVIEAQSRHIRALEEQLLCYKGIAGN